MKKILILMLSVLTLITISCKKSSTTEELPIETKCLLTESIFASTGDNGILRYTYDDKSRITKVLYVGEDYETNYSYPVGEITKVVKDGNTSRTFVYKLDAQNRIINETWMAGDYKIDYSYNNDGYVAQSIKTILATNAKTTQNYTYSNGNLTSFTTGATTVTVTYGTDLASLNLYNDLEGDFPVFYDDVLKGYYGKLSTNLPTRIASGNYNENFAYQKDAQGNINKLTMTSNDGKSYSLTNKFTCK